MRKIYSYVLVLSLINCCLINGAHAWRYWKCPAGHPVKCIVEVEGWITDASNNLKSYLNSKEGGVFETKAVGTITTQQLETETTRLNH